MSAFSARPRPLALAASLTFALLSGACGSDEPVAPHGSPVLTQVYWVAGTVAKLVWSRVPDPKLAEAVAPLATEIDFVFDRRLDGDGIEDRFTVGGVMMTRPKAMPPITVGWSDRATAPGEPPTNLVVSYNSLAQFGDDTSYVFARPQPTGLPSDTLVTFTLDLANLASEYGEPADAPATIPVKTTAFTASIAAPPAAVVRTYALPVVFGNRVSGAAAAAPFVSVTAAGVTVPSKVLADPNDRARVYVSPADCLGGLWPAGTKLTVTVDAAMTDTFGRALEAGVTATFETSGVAGPASDTCVRPDGGTDAAPDAAPDTAPDATVDAGAPEDAAADAPDAG
jgi:hypothetical protein